MRHRTILVYGDVMVDLYVTGSVKRDSPEAPGVPVLSCDNMDMSPGGAANVAANIASLGGCPMLVGVVGRDPNASLLEAALAGVDGVSMELLARDDRRTTTKTRFMADGKQLLRFDADETRPLGGEDETEVIKMFVALAPSAWAIVISDYAKGAVTPKTATMLIGIGRTCGIPVIVDAKEPAARHFFGATVIKPNLKEIAAALRMKEPQTDKEAVRAATRLWSKSKGTSYVLLTRGDKGMCLVGDEGAMKIEPHTVKQVDVTGAGDTVAAALALALVRGEDIVEAAHFANAAAAVAVTQSGTVCPTAEEVKFFYDRDSSGCRQAHRNLARAEAQDWLH